MITSPKRPCDGNHAAGVTGRTWDIKEYGREDVAWGGEAREAVGFKHAFASENGKTQCMYLNVLCRCRKTWLDWIVHHVHCTR